MKDLFEDFAAANLEAWKKQMEKDLKGLSYEQLSYTDDNGLSVSPFYNAENAPVVTAPLFEKRDWNICGMANGKSDAESNRIALEELNGGADSLFFFASGKTDFTSLLQTISIPHIRTWFSVSDRPGDFADAYLSWLNAEKTDKKLLNGAIMFDPLMAFARGYVKDAEEGMLEWKKFSEHPLFTESGYSPLVADCWQYRNAGANSVTELACTLAHVNEYLNLLQNNKNSLNSKELIVIASSDILFFESLSKFRALRNLLNFLLKQYEMENTVFIHAATPVYNKTVRDPYNNMLRTCVETMSAVLGGADSCYVFPFDLPYSTSSSSEARRWARNQQLILKEESFLNKVADTGAGSWFIEKRTAELEKAAWEEFKEIERAGGLIASLKSGEIQKKISVQAEAKNRAYANGKKILAGVNKFRNEKEAVKERVFNASEHKEAIGFFFPETGIEEEKSKQTVG